MVYSDTYAFDTTVGEQVYFLQWYHGAMSKSLTMWLVPFSLVFSFGFGFAAANWLLHDLSDQYEVLTNDVIFGLSVVAGGLCGICLFVVGVILMFTDYKTKRIGLRTAFDSEAEQTIKFETDGIRLMSGGSAITLEWPSITHVILFNGTVLVGAHATYVAVAWKHFVDIDHLIEFLRYCRKRASSNAEFKDVSFLKPFKDRRLSEFFES